MKFKFKIQQYQTETVEQTVNVYAGQPSKTISDWHLVHPSAYITTGDLTKNVGY